MDEPPRDNFNFSVALSMISCFCLLQKISARNYFKLKKFISRIIRKHIISVIRTIHSPRLNYILLS